MLRAAQFSEPLLYHGEGAVWDASWGGLRCVDMLQGDVLTFRSDGTAQRDNVGTIAAMVRPIRPGLSLLARENDIAIWHEESGQVKAFTNPLVPGNARLNEGGCVPDGSLLVGSMGKDRGQDAGTLLHIRPDGSHQTVLKNVGISNGIGFNKEGTRAHYIDSSTGRIDVFTVTENFELIERRPFAHVPVEMGHPDGLWMDDEGGVWVALYGGGRVQQFRSDGSLGEAVLVEARQVTSCTFGGPDLNTLFITTSRENLEDGDDPLAGSIFSAQVTVRGLPTLPFSIAEAI